jgi:hypothetical protein
VRHGRRAAGGRVSSMRRAWHEKPLISPCARGASIRCFASALQAAFAINFLGLRAAVLSNAWESRDETRFFHVRPHLQMSLCTSQDHLHMPIPHTGTAELANIQVHKKYHKKR